MRLIDTTTGLFEEFIGRHMPKYGILSHTWGTDEVLFQDMIDSSGQSKEGFKKVDMMCQIASQAGLRYVWIDTCCIDKSSSGELTEAINSMYRWYQRSEACYVFLSDLAASGPLDSALRDCRWFTRGWCLQELIAPTNIVFFDQDWNIRGTKRSMVESLSNITGVPAAILNHSQPLSSLSVAQKMSWAAHRETTRIEDTAYCLLGIFDVNMPLLYGEEEKAFRRLQEEIIKATPDFSIFAWRWPSATQATVPSGARIFSGVLADSPHSFAESKSLARLPGRVWREFSISNGRIKTQAQIVIKHIPDTQSSRYIFPLDCSGDSKVPLGILLRNCGPDEFIRAEPWTFVEIEGPLKYSRPRMRQFLAELPEGFNRSRDGRLSDMSHLVAHRRLHAVQVVTPNMGIVEAWPATRCDDEDRVFFVSGDGAWDSVALRLSTVFHIRTGLPNNELKFEFMFYALGWSSLDISQLHCSIIDYKPYASALKEVQAQITSWDSDRKDVLQQLVYHDIPKASAAVLKIPGYEDLAVLVSFKSFLVRNASVCQNMFWRIEISCKICEARDLPEITYGTWPREQTLL